MSMSIAGYEHDRKDTLELGKASNQKLHSVVMLIFRLCTFQALWCFNEYLKAINNLRNMFCVVKAFRAGNIQAFLIWDKCKTSKYFGQ